MSVFSMVRASVRFPLALSLTGLAAATACSRDPRAESGPAPTTVTVTGDNALVLEERLIRSGPSISGDLTPERQAAIRAELEGSVMSLLIEEGQSVRAGQLLGTLDESVVAEQYRSAKSNLVAAENAAQMARRESDRAKRLLAGGAIAERDLEIADRAQLAAEAQLDNAKAAVAAAERQWQKSQIRAPFGGIVSTRSVSIGDVVQAGTAMFIVVDPSSMQLHASVPAAALAGLKVGSVVEFDVSGYEGQTFSGRIERINPTVDPGTRQVRLVVSIPNTGRALVAGLFAKGRVSLEERKALAMPISAVDIRGATPMVRRLRGGKVELVAVQLGLRDDILELVEITGGLARGDTVLVGGAQNIAAGTPVVVTKE